VKLRSAVVKLYIDELKLLTSIIKLPTFVVKACLGTPQLLAPPSERASPNAPALQISAIEAIRALALNRRASLPLFHQKKCGAANNYAWFPPISDGSNETACLISNDLVPRLDSKR
jgi:hypothetical protein